MRDIRGQLDDLPLREEPPEAGEELVGDVDRGRAHAVRILQRDPLPLGELAGVPQAERGFDLLSLETGLAADGGVDVHSVTVDAGWA